jgi:glutamine synthetase
MDGLLASVKTSRYLPKYLALEQGQKIQCEYIWIGGSGEDIRSKTRTLPSKVTSVDEIPPWNYDGSSTGQADGSYSEIWLQPVKFVPDPFRGGDNILCLCETLNAKTMEPIATNKRAKAREVFEAKQVAEEVPWYGIEQEYTMLASESLIPLGWPSNGFPAPQGPYYCSVGSNVAFGRSVAESHYRACLFAGIDISGINAEVMPGQWEFQVGPCEGIDSGDQLWLARYLLNRIGEDFGVVISYEPKPIKGDWNGAGCHTNYSTKSMRADGGYKAILGAIKKLGKAHKAHMAVYGLRNEDRLTGKHETAKFHEFKYGVANRGASIRIPRQCELDQKGYLEDRRPAANMDPYQVTAMIAATTILDQTYPDQAPSDAPKKGIDEATKKEFTNKMQQISDLAKNVETMLNQLAK